MCLLSRVARRLLPLVLIVLAPLASAGAPDVRAPEEIADLLTPFLPDETAPGAGGQARLQRLISEILSTEGYFSPQIEFVEVDGDLRINVDPGPRTLIVAVDVAVDGPLAAKTRQELIAGWGLPVGQPFRQQDWNNAKQRVLSSLLGRRVGPSTGTNFIGMLTLASEMRTAKQQGSILSLLCDSGERYLPTYHDAAWVEKSFGDCSTAEERIRALLA